jgi:hypothetical protein
MGALRT